MDDDTTTKDDQYLTDVLSYSVDRLAKVRFFVSSSFPFVFTSSLSLSFTSVSFLFHFHNRSPNSKRFWRCKSIERGDARVRSLANSDEEEARTRALFISLLDFDDDENENAFALERLFEY